MTILLTTEQKQQALKWYNEGMPLITIAQHYGLYREDLIKELQNTPQHIETEKAQTSEYMLLGRLQSDCEYCIDNNTIRHLWGITIVTHIKKMRELHNKLIVKPEWLTLEQIKEYELGLQNLDK